jgi:hypothetical protein
MCKFFSFVSNGRGRYWYSDKDDRAEMKDTDFEADSHASIVAWHQNKRQLAIGGAVEDRLNKFEFNPITKEFVVDQINGKEDSEQAEIWANRIDFSEIVPELIIHEIYDPKSKLAKPTERDFALLKKWAKVWASVGVSVRASVGTSFGSVGASVWASVWASIGSVGSSVGASMWGYTSSFFDIPKWQGIDHAEGENPFQPGIDLWNRSLVPSFDGETWRLHSGPEMEVVWRGKL